jgi:hypothetical protein
VALDGDAVTVGQCREEVVDRATDCPWPPRAGTLGDGVRSRAVVARLDHLRHYRSAARRGCRERRQGPRQQNGLDPEKNCDGCQHGHRGRKVAAT